MIMYWSDHSKYCICETLSFANSDGGGIINERHYDMAYIRLRRIIIFKFLKIIIAFVCFYVTLTISHSVRRCTYVLYRYGLCS